MKINTLQNGEMEISLEQDALVSSCNIGGCNVTAIQF